MNSTSYSRYLEAKKTVDERSINLRVWNAFINKLNEKARIGFVSILDLGAGTGNSLFRVLKELHPCKLTYTVVDIEKQHVETLKENMSAWVAHSGGQMNTEKDDVFITIPNGLELHLRIVVSDIEDFLLEKEGGESYEGIIAQAILDLLNLNKVLPMLKEATSQDGLMYFPINFDGMTLFMPSYDSELDELIEDVYHDSMRHSDGDRSHTGRNLLMHLRALGMKIVEAGSSDWVVVPDENGKYISDEAYFLKHILFFVKGELIRSNRVDNQTANSWHSCREKQVDEGVLVYIAHQLDVLTANH